MIRILFISLFVFSCFVGLNQIAQAAPKKCLHVRVIVPYSVGTATDLIVRAYAETINRQQSGPLMKVLNKTQKTVFKKNMNVRPDGCQILAITQLVVSNYLEKKNKIEWSGFTPIAMLSRTPLAVVARGNLKDANLSNIMEVAAQNPNVIKIGETDNSLERMFRMNLEDTNDVIFNVSVFETARSNFLQLLSGTLDLGIISASAAKRRMDLKQLKVLALTDNLENSRLVGVPTLKEQGIDLAFGVDRGIFAPANTPPETAEKLMERFRKASEAPDLKETLGKIYTKTMFLDPDSYTQYFENLTADWSEMIVRAKKRVSQNSG